MRRAFPKKFSKLRIAPQSSFICAGRFGRFATSGVLRLAVADVAGVIRGRAGQLLRCSRWKNFASR
jgi:hypothetical protein